VRSAAELNAAIRAVWTDPRVPLTREQRAEYEALLGEWETTVRSEVVEAA
jgi:hypothetical protein